MKILFTLVFCQIWVTLVYSVDLKSYIGGLFSDNENSKAPYEEIKNMYKIINKLNDEMVELRKLMNNSQINKNEELIKSTETKLNFEIQNTEKRISQIKYDIANLQDNEDLVHNKIYIQLSKELNQNFNDISRQCDSILNETMQYCETTRIEEFEQAFNLHIKIEELLFKLFDLRNETLEGFAKFTNITKNLQTEMNIFRQELLHLNKLIGNLQLKSISKHPDYTTTVPTRTAITSTKSEVKWFRPPL